MVNESMLSPFKTLADNAGLSADVCLAKVLETESSEEGFDFLSGEIKNLLKDGIIDPVMVTCTAVRNSVSAVGTLVTSNHAIVETKDVS